MKRGENWFPKYYAKMLTENIFGPSHSRYIPLRQSSRFRARVAKGRPAFRDRITRGSLEYKIVFRKVGADLGKTENILSAHNDRVT